MESHPCQLRTLTPRRQISKTPLSMASFHLLEAFDAQIFQRTLTFLVPSPNEFLLALEMMSQGRDCGALVSVVVADDGPDYAVGRAEVQQGAPDIVVDRDNPVGARTCEIDPPPPFTWGPGTGQSSLRRR